MVVAGADQSELDDLYAIDPSEFIVARDAIAKRLRSEKRRDEAAEVAKLRRPSPSAWALNQVAREHPDLVTDALDAGARLREATEAAVGGDRDVLRTAMADDQAASRAVVDAATRHLGAKGAGLTQKLAGTVRAAVLDDEIADEWQRGVLTADHDASGFGFGTEFDAGPAPARKSGSSRPAAAPAKKGATKRPAPARDQKAARAAEKKAAAAAQDRAKREREAATAARAALREQQSELKAKVRELSAEARALARTAERREAAARSARKDADAAAEKLAQAQAELDAL